MNLKELYEKLTDISVQLYQNQDTGINTLAEMIDYIGEFFERLMGVPEFLNMELKDVILKFNDAVKCCDKLLLADIIYYDICNYIIEYAKFVENTVLFELREKAIKEKIKVDEKENYHRNMKAMENADIDIYGKMKKHCTDIQIDVIDNVAVDYYGNIAVLENERWWGLNSFYNEENAVKIGTEQIRKSRYIGTIYIFGLGNMQYIKNILKIVSNDTVVIIYEPNVNVFITNMYYSDMSGIFERRGTFVYVQGINEKSQDAMVECLSDNISARYLYTFISPGYDVLYGDILEERINSINASMRNALSIDITVTTRNEFINYNRIMNLSLLFDSLLLSDLKKSLEKKVDFEKVPAIIVAAGPSLDKNIEDLKEAAGKAFILATDSAMRMLDKHSIEPDAYLTIDPVKPQVLFENKLSDSVPLFYCSNSVFEHIKELHGRKVFCHIDNMLPPLIKDSEAQINAGGNVASSAFSVAQYLGFKNIIIIGQDLAFTDDKKHASVVYDEKKLSEENQEEYPLVKGQNGEMLRTFYNFVLYKEWYEGTLEKYKDELTCINATEGGAYIEGAIHMPLKDAIGKYCNGEADIRNIIEQCRPSFDDAQRKAKKEYIGMLSSGCDKAKEYWQSCCKCYEQIMETSDVNKIKLLMDKAAEYDKKVSDIYATDIIIDYSRREVDNLLDEMYAESENGNNSSYDEVKKVAQKGIAVLNIFMKNADRTKDIFEQCINCM